MAIFQVLFLGNIGQKNVFDYILELKIRPRLKKQVQKVEKLRFFQRG